MHIIHLGHLESSFEGQKSFAKLYDAVLRMIQLLATGHFREKATFRYRAILPIWWQPKSSSWNEKKKKKHKSHKFLIFISESLTPVKWKVSGVNYIVNPTAGSEVSGAPPAAEIMEHPPGHSHKVRFWQLKLKHFSSMCLFQWFSPRPRPEPALQPTLEFWEVLQKN